MWKHSFTMKKWNSPNWRKRSSRKLANYENETTNPSDPHGSCRSHALDLRRRWFSPALQLRWSFFIREERHGYENEIEEASVASYEIQEETRVRSAGLS